MLTTKQKKFKRLIETIAKKQLKEQTYTIKELPDEIFDRMDGLVNTNNMDNFISSATEIMATLSDEEFDTKDIFDYLFIKIVTIV